MRVDRSAPRRTAVSPWLGLALLCVACESSLVEPGKAEGGPAVLVVVDTLRADHLGVYGYARPTSVHLDAWANSARVYERAFATSPWTLASMGSVLTGRLPARHGGGIVEGPYRFSPIDSRLPTLAEGMKGAGYKTGGFVGNLFMTPRFGANRGFDTFRNSFQKTAPDAALLVDDALQWIDLQESQRFFVFLHLVDPHLPYAAPPSHRGRFNGNRRSRFAENNPLTEYTVTQQRFEDSDLDFIVAAYDEEIAYVDSQLDRLLTGLEEHGVMSGGIVLLTADHGEEFFEHDGFEHGHAMWQEVTHVPLMIWGAGVQPGRETGPVSVVDVPATILDASLGEAHESSGVSLWPNARGEAALPSRTLYAAETIRGPETMTAIRWPYKVISNPDRSHLLYFDLEEDAAEQRDLAVERQEDASKLAVEMIAHLASEGAQAAPRHGVELDDETLDLLSKLGYVE